MEIRARSGRGFAAAVLALLLAVPGARAEVTAVKAAEDLYFVTGTVCNTAFLVTGEGVLLVDTGNRPSHGTAILEAIRGVTDKPLRYIVFTHYHGDHVNGACMLPEDAVVVAHENLAGNLGRFGGPRVKEELETGYPRRIEEQKQRIAALDPGDEAHRTEAMQELERLERDFEDYGRVRIVYPEATYRSDTTLALGEYHVRLVHPGPGHTDGNTIVHFVEQKAVHMGDLLFYLRHPYIDWKAGCDTENWIAALAEVSGEDIDVVMPGHGDLTDAGGLEWMAGYLAELRGEVAAAVEAGQSLEEAKQSVAMPPYADIPWTYMLEAGIEAVYNEMTGAPR